jgi:hypothetical protein
MTRFAPALAATLAALVLTGCGGSGQRKPQPRSGIAATAPADGTAPAPGTVRTARGPANNASRHVDPRPRSRATTAAGKTTAASTGAAAANTSIGTVTPQTATAATSAPAFATAADAICRSYRREVSPANTARTLTEQEQVYPRVITAARRAISRLHRLSAPAGELAGFRRFIDHTSAAVDEFASAQGRSRTTQESTGVAAEQQDLAAFQRAGRDATAGEAAARHLGLKVCGSPGSDWL